MLLMTACEREILAHADAEVPCLQRPPEPIVSEVKHGCLVAAPLPAQHSQAAALPQGTMLALLHAIPGLGFGGDGPISGGNESYSSRPEKGHCLPCCLHNSLGCLDVRVPAVGAIGAHAWLDAGGCKVGANKASQNQHWAQAACLLQKN